MNKIFEFKGNFILKGKIECITGLHIGGSKDKLEIGGVDSPILRNPQTKHPYIPGSSLKGKLRHLLEYSTGSITNPVDGNLGSVSKSKEIVRLFGIGADVKDKAEQENKKVEKNNNEGIKIKPNIEDEYLGKIGITRLIIRDANPDKKTIKMWEQMESELLYTEYKPENTIDRLTAAANPRFIERVVADSRFNFEIIYGVYDMGQGNDKEDSQKDLNNLLAALRLLEDNTLGKSGSRGYGQIRFLLKDPIWVGLNDYQNNTEVYALSKESGEKELKILKNLSQITLTLPDNISWSI